AKGQTYYQVVEGVRDGARVRQRIVVSLGRTPDPAAALKGMRRELARLRQDRSRLPAGYPASRTQARWLERLDARIGEMEIKIETLARIIKSKMIGTTQTRKEG